jgi:ABC-2 type transport system permease protein
MRRTLAMYFRLVGIDLRAQMSFRLSFWVDLLTTMGLNASAFASLYLVIERFGNIAGWGLGELAFLYGMIETAFGTMDLLFGGFDPDYFSSLVREGRLDQILLRPVAPAAQIMGHRVVLRRFGRILQGVAVLAYAFFLVDVTWTPLKIFFLPVVLLSQVAAMGALFVVGGTWTIWTVQRVEAINILTYGGVELMSYPAPIYTRPLRLIFTYILPFFFLNYYPALFFLDRSDPLGLPVWPPLLAPLVAAVMLGLAMRFWNYGLRHYQSTGS